MPVAVFLFVVAVVVVFAVIARGALSPRGNPETNIVFVVVFPSPLAGEENLQSKFGEGSLFLIMPFAVFHFAVAVAVYFAVSARAPCRPWQSRN
jgi:hypothetical protein